MNAVILAGEDNKQAFIKNKSGILIKGIPMINYVIKALEEVSSITEIVVVGNRSRLESFITSKVKVIEGKDTMFDNFKAGAKHFNSTENILVVTSDIPLINSIMIEDFIKKALDSRGDLCYPIIHKKDCELKYPDLKRTYATLKEGTYTGGNIISINPEIIDKIEKKAKKLITQRKNPMAMTYILGVGFLLKLLTKQLTAVELENHLSRLFNIEAKAIVTEYPELGCDVDKEEHLEKIIKYLV